VDSLDGLLQQRCSVRAFQDKSVEKEKLVACVEAATLAPSARNNQPWRFIVVSDLSLREKLFKVVPLPKTGQEIPPVFVAMVQEIPTTVIPVGKHSHEYFIDIDHGLAAGFFCLKATELGLGSCIIGAFDEQVLKELLSVPAEKKIKIVMAVGYAKNPAPTQKTRKNLDEVMCENQYEKHD